MVLKAVVQLSIGLVLILGLRWAIHAATRRDARLELDRPLGRLLTSTSNRRIHFGLLAVTVLPIALMLPTMEPEMRPVCAVVTSILAAVWVICVWCATWADDEFDDEGFVHRRLGRSALKIRWDDVALALPAPALSLLIVVSRSGEEAWIKIGSLGGREFAARVLARAPAAVDGQRAIEALQRFASPPPPVPVFPWGARAAKPSTPSRLVDASMRLRPAPTPGADSGDGDSTGAHNPPSAQAAPESMRAPARREVAGPASFRRLSVLAENIANAGVESQLKPKYRRTTTTIGFLASMTGLGLPFCVGWALAALLRVDLHHPLGESANGWVWLGITLTSIPAILVAGALSVAWLCGLVLVRIGYIGRSDLRPYVFRSRCPEHWFEDSALSATTSKGNDA